MNPAVRRFLITAIVLLAAAGVIAAIIFSPGRAPSTTPDQETTEQASDAESAPATGEDDSTPDTDTDSETGTDDDDAASSDEPEAANDGASAEGEGEGEGDDDVSTSDVKDLTGLRARPVAPSTAAAPMLTGSLDPSQAKMQVTFTERGGGIERIALSEYWKTTQAQAEADEHWAAIAENATEVPPLPDGAASPSEPAKADADTPRYILMESKPYRWYANNAWNETTVPVFAAHSVRINDQTIPLSGEGAWRQTSPGQFSAMIENESGDDVLRIDRSFSIGDTGDITLVQSLTNLSGAPLRVRWHQYGPSELSQDRSRYMDRRRFRFGPQIKTGSDPDTWDVLPDENSLLFERASLTKAVDRAETAEEKVDARRLWPNADAVEAGYDLAWFASSNRYFATAIHKRADTALSATGDKSINDVVDKVFIVETGSGDSMFLFTVLYSPDRELAPGATTDFDFGIYAGPLDPGVLGEEEPFASLRLEGLILYQMSSFCAICTFQWLAHLLLGFLGFLHGITGDYGVAIIGLVIVVRLLLHPLVKKSQINMQRFSRGMSKLKPELEKIQKKYAGDQKRLQQEQMKLMREHNINPLQMLGCLPMFLQTPIWIALYAALYFAIELRHEAAFYGIFQAIGGWPFLGDLAAADHFFGEFDTPHQFFFWNITGINLLPILMGVVMYISQKYMSPPPSAAMSEEQLKQQKMMRIIFPLILPLAMYSAPSGLTLYILTSTTIGILESRYIRRHVDELDKQDEGPDKYMPRNKKKINKKDPHARAYQAAVERAKEERQRKNQKKFKKRK